MYCEKYKATIPEKTCLARQGKHLGNNAFGRQALDPGCQNCGQGRQVMIDFKKTKKTEENMSDIPKTCTKCGKPKPADKVHFYGDKRNPDNLGNWCKDCHNASSRKTKISGVSPARAESPDKTAQSVSAQPMQLLLDFARYEILYEDILQEAEDQLRSPEMQAVWLITQALYKERKTA